MNSFVFARERKKILLDNFETFKDETFKDLCNFDGASAEPNEALPAIEKPVFWTELTYQNRKFVFNAELLINIECHDGGWVFEADEYNLLGYGTRRCDADLSFRQVFVACWDNIALADDKDLTLDAMEIKRSMLALVKREEL